MTGWGVMFLAGLVLAPFTAGISLLLTLAVLVKAAVVTKPQTVSDEELAQWEREGDARVDAYLQQRDAEREAAVQSWIKKERFERERAARVERALNPEPSAYATYQCSNAMCRHKERLLTWHGDSQECENCGRTTYRTGGVDHDYH